MILDGHYWAVFLAAYLMLAMGTLVPFPPAVLRRNLLDKPPKPGNTEEAQIRNDFEETARIREVNGIASLEESQSEISRADKS